MVSKKELEKILSNQDVEQIEKQANECLNEAIKHETLVNAFEGQMEGKQGLELELLTEQKEFHEGIMKWNSFAYKRLMSKKMELEL